MRITQPICSIKWWVLTSLNEDTKETMIVLMCMLLVSRLVASEPVTTDEAKILIDYHNKVRSQVNPTATNMQKMVFPYCTYVVAFKFQFKITGFLEVANFSMHLCFIIIRDMTIT